MEIASGSLGSHFQAIIIDVERLPSVPHCIPHSVLHHSSHQPMRDVFIGPPNSVFDISSVAFSHSSPPGPVIFPPDR